MQVPLELTVRDVEGSTASQIRALVEAQVRKLEDLAPELIACRVAVEEKQRHQRSGSRYRVRVRATLPPHKELVGVAEPADTAAGTPLDRVVRDAFDAVSRQLRDERSRRRGDVKNHAGEFALVVRLFPELDYGFLEDIEDNHQIYFHRNSVVHRSLDDLAIGTQVRYVETLGDEGPQATSVAAIDRPGEGAREREGAQERRPQSGAPRGR